jgi:hypothetical protein
VSAGVSPRLDAPQHVSRYLLDAEAVVVAVRRHPAQVAEPVVTCVAGLLVAGWVSSVLPRDVPYVSDLLFFAWFALLGRAIWRMLEWQQDWFVATDRRLLLTYGLITRKVAMMPLAKVTDLSYNRSPMGRLLGYGEFILESAGQEQALRSVTWLPNPDELYRRICAEIFDPRQRWVAAPSGTTARRPGAGSPEWVGRDQVTEQLDLADPGDD